MAVACAQAGSMRERLLEPGMRDEEELETLRGRELELLLAAVYVRGACNLGDPVEEWPEDIVGAREEARRPTTTTASEGETQSSSFVASDDASEARTRFARTRFARATVVARSKTARYAPGLSWALLLFGLFERPAWCGGSLDKCGGDSKASLYPNSGISGRLPSRYAFALGTAIWLALVADVCVGWTAREAVRRAMLSKRYAFNAAKSKRRLVVQASVLVALAVDGFFIARRGFFVGERPRDPLKKAATLTDATCVLRCMLVAAYDRSVQTQLGLVARAAPELGAILFLLGTAVASFAWFGTLLWRDSTAQGREVFGSYQASLWNLLVAATTANFPDVGQRAYESSRASFLFFAAFMVVCLYAVLNLALAVVADAYAKSVADRQVQALQAKKANLHAAFRLLTQDVVFSEGERSVEPARFEPARFEPTLTRGVFLRLMEEFGILTRRRFDETQGRLVFAVLDHDGSGFVDVDAFVGKLVDALRLRFAKIREDASKSRARVRRFVDSATFEFVLTGVLVANLAFEIATERRALEGRDDDSYAKTTDGRPDTAAQIVATLFTVVYAVEISLKSYAVNGIWALCTRSATDCFDSASTLCGLAATAWVYVPNGFADSNAIRYALLLRTLRLIRFVEKLPAFQRVVASLSNVLPRAFQLFKLILFVGLFFASIGVALFGGRVTTDPDSPFFKRIQRKAPDFASAADVGYYADSMNDLGSALVTLFILMVVNNWFVLVQGYVATTSKLARLFFVAYWILMVLVCLNLLVATILDAFISDWHQYPGSLAPLPQGLSQPNQQPPPAGAALSGGGGAVGSTSLSSPSGGGISFRGAPQSSRSTTNPVVVPSGDRLTLDASRITGTETGLPRGEMYSVVLDVADDHLDRHHRRSLLRNLLTPAATAASAPAAVAAPPPHTGV